MKTCSTEEAAKQAGITRVTLARWLSAGRIRPSVAVAMKRGTLWRWSAEDVERVKKLAGKVKPGPKPQPQGIPAAELKKLRALIRKSAWKTATSARYKDAPHRYLIYFECRRAWKWLAARVRKYGTRRSWRGNKNKYLLVDGACLWIDWPALNKAHADTLD